MALLTHPKIESEAEGTININIPCINLEKLPHLTSSSSTSSPHHAYLRAVPRKQIFFYPTDTRAAIVRWCGLCPGWILLYGRCGTYMDSGIFIYGIQAGYIGFYSRDMDPLNLNPKTVHGWQKTGGTLL